MKQLICSTVNEWFQIKKLGLLYYFSDSENKCLISVNIIFKIKWLPTYFEIFCQKVLENLSMEICQKVLENLSMGTVQKMGISLPEGVRKFVNGYSAENGNVFAERC